VAIVVPLHGAFGQNSSGSSRLNPSYQAGSGSSLLSPSRSHLPGSTNSNNGGTGETLHSELRGLFHPGSRKRAVRGASSMGIGIRVETRAVPKSIRAKIRLDREKRAKALGGSSGLQAKNTFGAPNFQAAWGIPPLSKNRYLEVAAAVLNSQRKQMTTARNAESKLQGQNRGTQNPYLQLQNASNDLQNASSFEMKPELTRNNRLQGKGPSVGTPASSSALTKATHGGIVPPPKH
jgi:hypothetical protein